MTTVIEGTPTREQVKITEERKEHIRNLVTIYTPSRHFRPSQVGWLASFEMYTPAEVEYFASCLVEAAQIMREQGVKAGYAPD